MPNHWTDDLEDYDDRWRPIDIMLNLVWCKDKYIDLNTTTGKAFQLRSFKHGGPLERPIPINPVPENGYPCLQIEVNSSSSPDGKRTIRVKLHKLVWWSVNGPVPYGRELHHIDGNKWNCSLSNLEVLTPLEHAQRARETKVSNHPMNQPIIKKDDPVVILIQQLHESGLSLRDIANQVGYSYSTCNRILKGTYTFAP